jgi:hypothetical protein
VLLLLLLSAAAAARAPAAPDVVYGVNDGNFSGAWSTMGPQIAPLGLARVTNWAFYDGGNGPWGIPESQPVTLILSGHWPHLPLDPEGRAHYARAAVRLVRQHPSIREIQVWNEVDFTWPTDRLYEYLDLLAATHDALQGTGVKVLGFGFSPIKPRAKWVAYLVRWWYETRRWKRPIMDGYAYHPYWGWDARATWWRAYWMDRVWRGLPQPSPALGLKFWWTETGMWSSGPSWRRMVGSPAEQAQRVAEIAREAYCNPFVAADFNFLLGDEPGERRWAWKSGLYYEDGRTKPAFEAYRAVIAQARAGAIAC